MASNSDIQPKPPRKNGPGRPFVKGQSGNPAGVPRAAVILKQALACMHEDAGKRIHELIFSEDEKVALEATKFVIDHIKGKPSQPLVGEDGGALRIGVDMSLVEMFRKLLK